MRKSIGAVPILHGSCAPEIQEDSHGTCGAPPLRLDSGPFSTPRGTLRSRASMPATDRTGWQAASACPEGGLRPWPWPSCWSALQDDGSAGGLGIRASHRGRVSPSTMRRSSSASPYSS